VKHAAATDIGLRREENQDSFGVIESEHFKLYVVADGMGGVKGGGIASNLAVNVIKECLEDRTELNSAAICSAVEHANAEIFEKGSGDPSLAGMGTTYVGIGFVGTKLLISSVGDSRAYRIRDNHIAQLTTDHTLVQELLKSGAISPEQADNHPVSHMLTRSLGPGPSIEVDCWLSGDGPARGDMYVLCSDGLYNLVHDHEIAAVMQDNYIDVAVQKLVQLANERGGTDNITVIAVEVGEEFPVGPDAFEGAPMDEPITHPPLHTSPGHQSAEHSEDLFAEPRVEDNKSLEGVLVNESVVLEPKIEITNVHQASNAGESEAVKGQPAHEAAATLNPGHPGSTVQPASLSERWAHLRGQPLSRAIVLGAAFTVVTLIGFLGGFYAPRMLGAGGHRVPVEITAPEVPQAQVARLEPEVKSDLIERKTSVAGIGFTYQGGSPVQAEAPSTAPESNHELGLAPDEYSRVLRRKNALEQVVAELDEKISAFDKPLSARLADNLRSVREHKQLLETEQEDLRAQIDVATRKLAVWYGRRKRLAATDPINLAAEVAVASSAVKEKKEVFELATWSYLKEAEVLRYNPSDSAQEKKVVELAKARKERQRELTEEVKRAIESEVSDSDKSIAELTFKRDKTLNQIEETRREEEYLKILMSSDAKAKDIKRRELSRERELAEAELDELAHIIPSDN
jgi:protein phosphatase